jgi:NitT/TauT family transport system permease protein
MAVIRTFPSRDTLQRFRFRPIDVAVGVGVFLLLYAIVRVGSTANVPIRPSQATTIGTSPSELPYYAARSLLRMFIALFFSYAFSLGYAYMAARSRRARAVLIPAWTSCSPYRCSASSPSR